MTTTTRRLLIGLAAYVLVGFLYGFLSAAWQERHLLLHLLRGQPPVPPDTSDASHTEQGMVARFTLPPPRWWCTNCAAPNRGAHPCFVCGAASPMGAHEYVQRLR